MAVEWSGNLATGVEWQDRHHKEMFKRVNALLDAMSVGMGKEEVGRLFDFLDSYFIVHFDAEARAMRSLDYPQAEEHIREHAGFMEDVSKLRLEFDKGPSAALVIKMQRRLVDWLINHIGGMDKTLGYQIMKNRSAAELAQD